MPFAAVDGCRLYYRLEGVPGRPLLLLVHSLGTDHGMWDPQLPELLLHFQILRIDLRGHGASGVTPEEYTISQLAEDILAITDQVGSAKFHYCGLSLGGMIGQWIAARKPGTIDKLILANTSPRMPDPAAFDTRRATVLEKGMKTIEQEVIGRFFLPRTIAAQDPVAETIRATLLATDPRGYANCCSAIRDMDQRSLLAEITCPVLVIAGDHDISTPWLGHGDLLAALIPNARAVWLAAAHLSNVDEPAYFTAEVTRFLTPDAH